MIYRYRKNIQLHVKGRISEADALRQEETAQEILRRFTDQPGVILADEVGMGKTFVALAVAVSVTLSDRGGRPVAIMVPPSLKEKWPTDFEVFREKCLPGRISGHLNYGRADRAVEFLKLLDDPPERKKRIIFITHGAMSRGLRDRWVMLALISRSLHWRRNANKMRDQLSRSLGDILRLKKIERKDPDIWIKLLNSHPSKWLGIMHASGIDPEDDDNPMTDDDPVPEAIQKILPELDLDRIYACLQRIPQRKSKYYNKHIRDARREIYKELRSLWTVCVKRLRLKLPLLILDEAHHLKNPKTRLASLFQVSEARDDADSFEAKGPLGGVFERMLFLTATPFQLGHDELCSILDRFEGISWRSGNAPVMTRKEYITQLKGLRAALDAAQEAAVTLDSLWGLLRKDDLKIGELNYEDVDKWWNDVSDSPAVSSTTKTVLGSYTRTKERMNAAEEMLRPWIIRHLRPRQLPPPDEKVKRRVKLPGRAILSSSEGKTDGGIPVSGESLLPFLLAARATSHAPEKRPVFAEGLASSYEAFLHTRRINLGEPVNVAGNPLDTDDHEDEEWDPNEVTEWYLGHLQKLVPHGSAKASASHPKIAATIQQVQRLWESGEKVLVFCHYIVTGQTLRQRISEVIQNHIRLMGSKKLGCKAAEVSEMLENIGLRFYKEDSPLRRACDSEAEKILDDYPFRAKDREKLVEIVRRYVRRPSFLVRFFPLKRGGRLREEDLLKAFDTEDRSGLTLRDHLRFFFEFLVERCGKNDRKRYITAVRSVQTGQYQGTDVTGTFLNGFLRKRRSEMMAPNVRLVNGSTPMDVRQRLMLTFNTPFFPEILIASSVMAEGVDLHLNCRHVIHHDLCWNPSTLEQRTGRIDRIGAKVEQCKKPILLYLPYISETQDEKMYRVVMDRERWFNVVMGEEYKVDVRTTDKLAERVVFPESAAKGLAFRLEV